MSYLALYRKFRPTDFDGMVGQGHINTTLKNQILMDRVGHAYLFCGSRGTGKTSLAKIFAKAVNCTDSKDGNPCGTCDACLSFQKSGNMDIIEIDAASNNGVDDLRDLRDKVQFQPVSSKYKVYIIDEVHMLSISAFNALLKTLEEPPAHVIFILATTEVHKIPQTILSRCMRFDFKLIAVDEIYNYIKMLYKKIGKEADDEAIYAIAKAGEGSMRDALSIADICLSISDGKLTFDEVNEIVGNLSHEKLEQIFSGIISGNSQLVLNLLDEYLTSGKSVQLITRDIFQFVRDVLVVKMAGGGKTLSMTKEVQKRIEVAAVDVDNNFLMRALEVFTELEPKFKISPNPRIVLETALLRLTNYKNDVSIFAMNKKIVELERVIARGFPQNTNQVGITQNANQGQTNLNSSSQRESSPSGGVSKDTNASDEESHIGRVYISKEKQQEIANNQEKAAKLQEISHGDTSKTVVKKEVEFVPLEKNLKGRILRELRVDYNPSLFALVNYSLLDVDKSSLILTVSSNLNKEYIMQEENYRQIINIAEGFGYEKLVIKVAETVKDNSEGVLSNLKKLVGDLLEVID